METILKKSDQIATLQFEATSLSFYFDAGIYTMGGCNGQPYHHGNPQARGPWFTQLPIVGRAIYTRNHVSCFIVWDESVPWDGDIGFGEGIKEPAKRIQFLTEYIGFERTSPRLHTLELKGQLKADEIACYHGYGPAHVAWIFRTPNTKNSFDGKQFDTKITHKLIKIHTEIIGVEYNPR